MSVPNWYSLLLLAAAAYRSWRIIGVDEIADRPRAWLIRRLRENLGRKFELLIRCPWCSGTYVTLAWWGAWQLWPHGTLVAAAPFAIGLLVGLIAVNLDP